MATTVYSDAESFVGDATITGALTVTGGITAALTGNVTGDLTGAVTGGDIIGLTPVITSAGDGTPTAAQCKGQLWLVTQTGTLTLPAVSAATVGSVLTVYSTTAAAVMVDPNANDRIVLDGVAGGNGKKITSESAAGDFVTLICDSADGWTVIGRSGTWTMES